MTTDDRRPDGNATPQNKPVTSTDSPQALERSSEDVMEYVSHLGPVDPPTKRYEKWPSEIVLAIVSPLGTNNAKITSMLVELLDEFDYQGKIVKVTNDVFPLFISDVSFDGIGKYKTARRKIAIGNAIRQKTRNKAVLATGVAVEINRLRDEADNEKAQSESNAAEISTSERSSPKPNEMKSDEPTVRKTAYIVDSLKNPEEVTELRRIYGDGFFLFAVHCDRPTRIAKLQGDRNNIPDQGMYGWEAESLIELDEDENDKFGQHTRDAFPLADFFLYDENNDAKLKYSIQRCLDLIFGCPTITPTFHEYAMFMAFAASLRSADLSRQVGAVVANNNKEIISSGANDCPAFGGGLYWQDFIGSQIADVALGRDYMRGHDSNVFERNRLTNEIADKILSAEPEVFKNCLDKETKEFVKSASKQENNETKELLNEASAHLLKQVLQSLGRSKLNEIIGDTSIKSLTEYGRVVHAEMEALMACARNNFSCRNATLYCTTFPCHNCAKHIIAAGIRKVVYVEPYPKSKALEFHNESVTIDSTQKVDDKVAFEPFIGVGPRQFFDLFSLSLSTGRSIVRKNKENGKVVAWNRPEALPRKQMLPLSTSRFDHIYEYLAETGVKVVRQEKNNAGTQNNIAKENTPTDSIS